MSRSALFLGVVAVLLALAAYGQLAFGAQHFGADRIVAALFAFDEADFDHHVIALQRLPRALVAAFVGALMAPAGAVLQGMLRNPLASPSIVGLSGGAALFVIGGVALFDLDARWQGAAAAVGAWAGFGASLAVARVADRGIVPGGTGLILAGSIVSMALFALCNALLLSDPPLRTVFLPWLAGDINHAYVDRLRVFWPLGLAGLGGLLALSRSLTLMMLGPDKAATAGVDVARASRLAIGAVALSAGTAVAVCGPIGFVGLAVPHVVRPFTGAAYRLLLPACALAGATLCLATDLVARTAFAPRVVPTGVVMDLLGGIVFAVIVRRVYLRAAR